MGKFIDTSFIVSGASMSFKRKVLEHIMLMSEDNYEILLRAMYPRITFDPTKIYVLQGARNSTVPPIYTIPDGVCYWQHQIFYLDANTFTAAATAVVVTNRTYSTGPDGDPVEFTDGSSHNVLATDRMQVIDGNGSSPGYVANYADVIFLIDKWHEVGSSGEPAFGAAGWTNKGGASETLGFILDYAAQRVYMKGDIFKNPTDSGGVSTVFVLPNSPINYRPAKDKHIAITAYYDSGPNYVPIPMSLQIVSNGNVNVYTNGAIAQSSLHVGLDGVFFDL